MEGRTVIVTAVSILLIFLGVSYASSITGNVTQEASECIDLADYPRGLIINDSFEPKIIKLCEGTSTFASSDVTYDAATIGGTAYSITSRTVEITTSGVSLDCNFNPLVGSKNEIGIVMASPNGEELEDITVKNCNLKEYGAAILGNKISSSTIEKNTVSNADIGVMLKDSPRNTIQGNAIYGASTGIQLDSSSSVVINNFVDGSSEGLKIEGGERLSVYENKFKRSGVALELGNVNSADVFDNYFDTFNTAAIKSTGSKAKVYYNLFDKSDSEGKFAEISNSNITWTIYGPECLEVHKSQPKLCLEGNYWSEYAASNDKDNNGLGDVSFEITSREKDFAPFIKSNFELSEICESGGGGNGMDDNHDGHIDEGCIVVLSLAQDSDEFSLLEGDSVQFTCKESEKHTFAMVKVDPPVISVNGIKYALSDKITYVDINKDGKSDISITFAGVHPRKLTAGILLVKLGPCKYYCGNDVCDPGETTATCERDCLASSCGNDICDQGETKENCFGDCRFKINFMLVGVIIVIGIVAFVIFYEWKTGAFAKKEFTKRPSRPIDLPKEERPKPKAPEELKSYAQSYLDKGYSADQIKEVLEVEGWKSNEIDLALEELASGGESMGGSESTSSSLDELRVYVSKARKSMSDEDIRVELKKSGWDDAVIDTVLKEK